MRVSGTHQVATPAWSLAISLVVTHLHLLLADGLNDCPKRYPNCVEPARLVEDFECPGKGRFPVVFNNNKITNNSGNNAMFYRCIAGRHLACQCTCPVGKYFNPFDKKCRRFKTSTQANHYSKVQETKPKHRSAPIYNHVKSDNVAVVTNPGYKWHQSDVELVEGKKDDKIADPDVISSPNVHTDLMSQNGLMGKRTADGGSGHSGGRTKTTKSGKEKKFLVEDDSLFPAWAIAFLVLCVVILMVLVVLILY